MKVLKYLPGRSITLMDASNLVSGTESFGDELFNFVEQKRSRRQFCDTLSRKGVIAPIPENQIKGRSYSFSQ